MDFLIQKISKHHKKLSKRHYMALPHYHVFLIALNKLHNFFSRKQYYRDLNFKDVEFYNNADGDRIEPMILEKEILISDPMFLIPDDAIISAKIDNNYNIRFLKQDNFMSKRII